MDNLPKRDDDIYLEIEKFEDYELTECIAYEMAIRTPLVKEYIKLTKESNSFIKTYELKQTIINDCWIHYKDICIEHNKQYNILDNMPSHINNKTTVIPICNDNRETAVIDNNELSRQAYKTTSRPLFRIPKEYKSDILVNINFNLPKKEIIKYIEKLKDFNDKRFSIGVSKSMINKDKIVKYNNPLPTTKGKADTLQKRWAEWFYIYDCYKILKEKNEFNSIEVICHEIDLRLILYYDSNNEDYYSIKTYKNTIRDMQKYIDKYEYKELIVGHKALG